MKILVVSYDELNSSPSNEQVINDIIRGYDNASIECRENMGRTLRDEIERLKDFKSVSDVIITFWDTHTRGNREKLPALIKCDYPDLLVSYNLAGFELHTLTDSLSYNLIDCRQFHIVMKKQLPNSIYMNKLKSINLFVFEMYE